MSQLFVKLGKINIRLCKEMFDKEQMKINKKI